MQTNEWIQSAFPQPFPYQALLLQATPPPPITWGPGTRQFSTATIPQSPQQLLQLASPKPAYPASLVPALRNHNKGSCPSFPPCSLCHLTAVLSPVVCCGMLGVCEYTKLLPSWQSFLCLLFLPNMIKTNPQVSLTQLSRMELRYRTRNLVNQKHQSGKVRSEAE